MHSTLLLLTLLGAMGSAHAAPPNVLFLMADQLRFDALGSAGYANAATPNLDQLAQDGVRFTRAYTSTPTCTPARAAILTGLSPWNHGMLGYGVVAPRYAFEMPRALSEAGYWTQVIGKDHFGWNSTLGTGIPHGYQSLQLYDGLGTGFANGTEYDNYDQWFQQQRPGEDPLASGGLGWNTWRGAPYIYSEELHPTAWVGSNAVRFLQTYAGDKPFFLKASFHRPHSPYDPPARLLNATNASSLPPVRTGGDWEKQFSGLPGSPPGCGPSAPDAWCGLMPEDEATLGRRAYHANIRFVDEWVGSILAALQARGWDNNTFVVFVSDHGDGQGDHYLWRKGYPYEISSHVPFLLRWPDSFPSNVARGSALDFVVELRDILPTVLDIAGVPIPNGTHVDGCALTCLLRDPTAATCPCGPSAADSHGQHGQGSVQGSVQGSALRAGSASSSLTLSTSSRWREWIGLEHDLMYNETIHWSALTDGQTKYVFQAFFASEQLFNLTNDRYEAFNLANDPAYASELALWRSRLVAQFEQENRGPAWVKDGVLQRRVASQLYSPNYPGPIPPSPPPSRW